MMEEWKGFIFSEEVSFEEKVQRVFEYQFENNEVYRRYCEALGIDEIKSPNDAPLLLIKAFKDTEVITSDTNSPFTIDDSQLIFKSSGTTDMQRSVHHILDASIYDQSLLRGFRQFYDLDSSIIWGYTPGYGENPHSSLIYMIQKLIEQNSSELSCFLPLGQSLRQNEIEEVKSTGKQLLLFGAAFGLMDLVEKSSVKLPSNSIVIETGGMKTHRRELSRQQLHRKLTDGFGLDSSRIHSEYGMCELLSQAYATGGKWFQTVPWLQVSIRNPDDPQQVLPPLQEGLIGVIDLANIHSCSFLLTGDRGIQDANGRFQVLGRWNPKDLRGCNFLIEED